MTVEGRLLWVYSGEQAAENQAGYGSKTRRGKEGKGPSFTIRPIHQPSPFQNSDPKQATAFPRYPCLFIMRNAEHTRIRTPLTKGFASFKLVFCWIHQISLADFGNSYYVRTAFVYIFRLHAHHITCFNLYG